MVFVKVRETYDLHTVKNKMTVIGIHTPDSSIIKKNFPGLLMQCKAYRPYSCDVRIACASVLPLDPRGVGTSDTDVAPEDVFNPILYKAMSNKGMSQLEARIHHLNEIAGSDLDINGPSAGVDVDTVTDHADEFSIYYGLLSNAHDWKHANPQAGLQMASLRPLVYDVIATQGDIGNLGGVSGSPYVPQELVDQGGWDVHASGTTFFLGKAKEMPFINCTSYSLKESSKESKAADPTTYQFPGFGPSAELPVNAEITVPWVKIMCGCIIIPPSRLHELFYRMVVEWTVEFSSIRPLAEITNFDGLGILGNATHFQNYSYSASKKAVTGSEASILDKSDVCMVSANVDVNKVM